MRYLLCFALVFWITGCTTGQVWVISQSDSGGKIGYHGYLTGPSAKEAVASKVGCRPYELNEDVERERAAAADAASSSKVPDSSIEDWHEVSYSCVK